MNNVLEVKGLCKDYARVVKKPEANEFALKNVTFNMPKGYIMGFIGPNGAGKTTVIKLILGIKKPDAGAISLFGQDIAKKMQNDRIGMVLDFPHFPDEWTLLEVEKALKPFYQAWDTAYYAWLLKKFGLSPNKKVKALSRGMQVKLQIAIALSHHAQLLILDEPTSGLDPVARDEVCELLQEFVEDGERSVLFSTHITSDLEKVADYATMILDGEIRFTGTKDDLLEKYMRITGGRDDIDAAQKEKIIGFRKHGAGFEGLLDVADMADMPASVLMEAPTLEEIIVFMNKGAALHGEA